MITPRETAMLAPLTVLVLASAASRVAPPPTSSPSSTCARVAHCLEISYRGALLGLACGDDPGGALEAAVRALGLPPACQDAIDADETAHCAAIDFAPDGDTCVAAFAGEMPAGRRLVCGKGIHLNSDSAKDLEQLPGIGPVRAAAIVNWRARNGPFESPDDLRAVHGIGEKTVERVRPWLEATNPR